MTGKRQPWMKWYPADWRADPGLRVCSYAARGLWADMLTIMHEAERYGRLLVNGIAPSSQQIARMLGGSAKEVDGLIEELESAGVFSRDDDGTIYSRRMVRDKAKAEQDAKNGRKGGNPNVKAKHNPKGDPPDKPPVKRGVNPQDKGEDKAQKPEARSQKSDRENHPPPSSVTAARVDEDPNVMAVVVAFEKLRERHWPNDSRLPAPGLTLKADATEFLKDGGTVELITAKLDEQMAKAVAAGKSPPNRLKAYRLSIGDAIKSEQAKQRRDGTETRTGDFLSDDQRRKQRIDRLVSERTETSRRDVLMGKTTQAEHDALVAGTRAELEALGDDELDQADLSVPSFLKAASG